MAIHHVYIPRYDNGRPVCGFCETFDDAKNLETQFEEFVKQHGGCIDEIKCAYEKTLRLEEEQLEHERMMEERHRRLKQEMEELNGKFKIASFNIHKTKCEDGFYDYLAHVVVEHVESGESLRMIEKNIFDFGYFNYPERVGGTEDVFKSEKWTEIERKAGRWLLFFGVIDKRMRM